MFASVNSWFNTTLGKRVLETEKAIIEQLLPGFFGYHLLQLSVQDQVLYDGSPIRHKILLKSTPQNSESSLIASPDLLPFEDDSLDVVLLHHLLDFQESPQNLLREVTRVARPMGQVVIVGFNPFSLWGMWKPIGALRKRQPWQGKFISPGRLMDWLTLLNFKIDRAQYSIYGLPYSRKQDDLSLDDYSQGLSRNPNWPFGAIYVIVARKQVGTMTPIKPVWKNNQTVGKLSVVRPTAGRDIATSTFPPFEKSPPFKKEEE